MFSESNHKVSNSNNYNVRFVCSFQYTLLQYLSFWKKSLEKFHYFFVQNIWFQYQGNDSLILQQFYQFLHM